MGHIFHANLRNYARTVRPKTNKLDTVSHVGDGSISTVSGTPHLRGAGNKDSPIFGLPLYLCLHPLMQMNKLNVVTHGAVLGGQPRPRPKGWSPSDP